MKKWWAPILVYLGVGIGLFFFKTAWSSLLTFHLAILVSLFLAKPKIPLKFLFKTDHIEWVVLSVLFCGSSGITLYYLWEKFSISDDLVERVHALGLNADTWPIFIAYFTLVNPFLEEYFWRAFLGSNTTDFHPSDFLYAGFHGLILMDKVQTNMIIYSLALLVLAGWFWRQIMRADQGLLASVLGHMAADFTILMAVYWRLQ